MSTNAGVCIVRLASATADAHTIIQEYYEAVHVVQRDEPGALQSIIDAPASGIWLAYVRGEVAGCVVLRRLTAVADAAECKLLYVKPAARGHNVAGALLDMQEQFARDAGIAWIYLDTYDDLTSAIALYERRGYVRCERYNDNPQATLFMRKCIARVRPAVAAP